MPKKKEERMPPFLSILILKKTARNHPFPLIRREAKGTPKPKRETRHTFFARWWTQNNGVSGLNNTPMGESPI